MTYIAEVRVEMCKMMQDVMHQSSSNFHKLSFASCHHLQSVAHNQNVTTAHVHVAKVS
jgi:hypothetical protein